MHILICCILIATSATSLFEERVNVFSLCSRKTYRKFDYAKSWYNNIEQFWCWGNIALAEYPPFYKNVAAVQ